MIKSQIPMAVDRRIAAPRHRVLKSGTIEFGGSAIDCIVRNVSTNGAALDVATPVGIPTTFSLAIPRDGLHFACRVLWRKERRIGVKFV
jgi:PilZ domain